MENLHRKSFHEVDSLKIIYVHIYVYIYIHTYIYIPYEVISKFLLKRTKIVD